MYLDASAPLPAVELIQAMLYVASKRDEAPLALRRRHRCGGPSTFGQLAGVPPRIPAADAPADASRSSRALAHTDGSCTTVLSGIAHSLHGYGGVSRPVGSHGSAAPAFTV